MTLERFRQVEAVFDAAADGPSEERGAILDRLCGADLALRAEVESLLAATVDATLRIRDAIGRAASEVAPIASRSRG